jgi:hypothetical protein
MTAYAENNTIALKISPNSPYIEATAVTAITPGKLCLLSGAAGNARVHNDAEGPGERLFAVENIYKGQTINDDYEIGSRVMLRICRPGDLVLAWWTGVSEPELGFVLTSDGAGNLKEPTVALQIGGLYAVVAENPINWTSPERIAVRIL